MSRRQDQATVIPPELNRSGPRPVALTGQGRGLVALAIALVAGAVAVVAALYTTAHEQRARAEAFAAEGVRAEATITEIRRGGGQDSRRTVRYRYSVGGEEFTGSVRLRPRSAGGVGDRLAIVYLPATPGVHYVEARGLRSVPIWLVPLLPLAMMAGAVLIARNLQSQKRLVESGRPVLAAVTGSKKVSHQYGSHFTVTYEFRLPSGASRLGSYQVQKHPPDPGTPVLVIYDRDAPERNKRYPLCLARVAANE